jgi:hypothetical protein
MSSYLFTTFIVLFFAFPGGSTACLSRARGPEILMLETGSCCFLKLPLSPANPQKHRIFSGVT